MPSAPKPNTSVPYSNRLPFSPSPASLWKGSDVTKSGDTGSSNSYDVGTATDKG